MNPDDPLPWGSSEFTTTWSWFFGPHFGELASEGYIVRVWDNFHYGDDSEAYDIGPFPTHDEALAKAKAIVEESVANHRFDMAEYCGFGDDPGIICPPGTSHPRFSARDYARELCERKGAKPSSSPD